MCVVNSWLIYKADCTALKQKSLALKTFKMELAMSLKNTGKTRKTGRPSTEDTAPKIKFPTKPRPDTVSRTYLCWSLACLYSKGKMPLL